MQIVIKKQGPNSYTYGGVEHRKGEPQHVDDASGKYLVETGHFEEVGKKSTSNVPVKKNPVDKAHASVGKFKSKKEAIDYAQKVHGTKLDEKIALGTLNKETVRLYKEANPDQPDEDEATEAADDGLLDTGTAAAKGAVTV